MTAVRPTTTPAAVAAFDVRIEELVLHGFPPDGRHEIAAALEEELARLLAARPVVPAWLGHRSGGDRVQALDGGVFDVPPDPRPRVVGTRLAQAIHHALVAGPGRRDGADGRGTSGMGGTGAIR
ncbi:hypothetical protein ACFT30_08375 [Microbacterium ureisolvens]|uniref:hypothetical protein n=1 Tax=Microbacterium ureisolvens TaxID=2781186 RepID=UPI003629DCF3